MPLKPVFVEPIDPREFEPGGSVHALAEEARRGFGLPVFTARHRARRRGARGFLTRGEDGHEVAAFLIEPDGTLFEMDAAFATDTEVVCESFRRVLVDGAVTSVLFRSDDSFLLPLTLSEVDPGEAAIEGHLLYPRSCGPLTPARRAEATLFVEIERGDVAVSAVNAIASRADELIAAGRVPFVELGPGGPVGPDERELLAALRNAGFRAAIQLFRLPAAKIVSSAPKAPPPAG